MTKGKKYSLKCEMQIHKRTAIVAKTQTNITNYWSSQTWTKKNKLLNQVILRCQYPLVHICHPSCISMEYVCSHDNNDIRIHLQIMLIIQKTSLF